MALTATHGDTSFRVGDVVRVSQRIQEGEKSRIQVFEGTVLGIKGRGISKTFLVRRIGVQQIGIEKIFPLEAPVVEDIEVVKHGGKGVRRAKLYYIRNKSRKEISRIYSRTNKKDIVLSKDKPEAKKATLKKVSETIAPKKKSVNAKTKK